MSATAINRTFGLKWNPFAKDLPDEGLVASPTVDLFVRRVERLVDEGGFAMVTGDPGVGKSVAMRILHRALKQRRDVTVAHLDRPQSKVADFYRELADAFAVSVGASNRWGGFRMLRERWRSSIESKLLRPVLLIDEAQEIPEAVMSEIRILTSDDFDSRSLLTVVFAGDSRLQANLATPEMLPIESRLRVKVTLQAQATPELTRAMQELCAKAGNPNLMTPGLMPTLADHAHGNFRSLMHIANELLAEAYERKADKIDEKLYMEVMSSRTPATQRSSEGRRKTASLRG